MGRPDGAGVARAGSVVGSCGVGQLPLGQLGGVARLPPGQLGWSARLPSGQQCGAGIGAADRARQVVEALLAAEKRKALLGERGDEERAATGGAAAGGSGKRPYVRFKDYAPERAALRAKPPPGADGSRVKLLVEPVVAPEGWQLVVNGVNGKQGAAVELALRTVEACRLVPMVPRGLWPAILDETAEVVDGWAAAERLGNQLDAVGAWGGHAGLADARTTLYGLAMYLVVEEGRERATVWDERVGATSLKKYLKGVAEGAHAKELQRLVARGEAPDGDAAEAAGGHAAPKRLGVLRSKVEKMMRIDIAASHSSLDQFSRAPKAREGRSAPTPEIGQVLHCEVGAVDEGLSETMRGCFAMAALMAHVCVRHALACRSGRLEEAGHGLGLGRAGVDFKKKAWGSSGRALVCSRDGFWGDGGFWAEARGVLAAGGFEEGCASLLRHIFLKRFT